MKIAIVSDYYLDYVGGAQTSMRQQKLALEEAGHTVVFVSPARAVRGRRYERTGHDLSVRPVLRLPGLDFAVIPNTARTVRCLTDFFLDEVIDVVHVQTEFGLAHASAAAAARAKIPIVHTVHSFYWASEGGLQGSVAWLMRFCLGRMIGSPLPRLDLTKRPADNVLRNLVVAFAQTIQNVVSPSAHQAADLAAAGVGGVVSVIPNPVATPQIPSNPLLITSLVTPNFLWVARCEPVKRPLAFARAAISALARTGNGFTVDFVGEGTDLAALKKLVANYPQITVNGALPHDRVLAMMDISSAVVLTSVGFDNQPMTVAEAVSRERGVLYCDPTLREGLQHAGYLSKTPDEAGLADAIVTLVTNPSLLVSLSAGALVDRELFSPARYVEQILAVYQA